MLPSDQASTAFTPDIPTEQGHSVLKQPTARDSEGPQVPWLPGNSRRSREHLTGGSSKAAQTKAEGDAEPTGTLPL